MFNPTIYHEFSYIPGGFLPGFLKHHHFFNWPAHTNNQTVQVNHQPTLDPKTMKNEGFTPQNMDKNPKNEGCGFPWQPVTSGLDPSYEEFVSKGQGSKPTHKVWRWKVAGFISRSHFF